MAEEVGTKDNTKVVGIVRQGDVAPHIPDDNAGDFVEAISAAP